MIKGIRLSNSNIHLRCLPILIFEFCFETLRQIVCLTEKAKLCLSHLRDTYQLLTGLSLRNTCNLLRGIQREREKNYLK